jgi:hypothetical protein
VSNELEKMQIGDQYEAVFTFTWRNQRKKMKYCSQNSRSLDHNFKTPVFHMSMSMSRVQDLAALMHLGLINWPFVLHVQSREP